MVKDINKKEKLQKIFSHSYLYIILALLYAPIMFVIIFSFSNSSDFTFSKGFNFDAYVSIFTSAKTPALMAALKNTIIIAVASSVIATALGAVAAIGIFNLRGKVRRLVENTNQLPIINSEIVMAVSLMIFFSTIGFSKSPGIGMAYVRLICGHVAFCAPYVVLSVMPRLQQMDPNIYEAALDLGATPVKALWKVIIPMIMPGIMSGFMLALTLSMDDFIITQMNKGASSGLETLSTMIYSDARVKGIEPFWLALSSIIFVIVLASLLVINMLKSRSDLKLVKQAAKVKKVNN